MIMALFVSGAYPEFAYWTISGEGIFINMLGGVTTFLGPMVGTVLLLILNDTVTRLTEYHGIVLGIVILFFAIGLRKGLMDFAFEWFAQRARGSEGAGLAMLEIRGALKILWRRQGDRQRHARLCRRLAHRRDRPERRGQEHLLQPDHRRAEAGCRPDPARRRRSGRPHAARHRPPRHRPRLPGRQHLSLAHGRGNHAGRRRRRPAPRRACCTGAFRLARRATAPNTPWNCSGLPTSADRTAATLSHGDQKLLDIALALVLDPKVLLLDEPTAGMGTEERWRMIDKVRELWETQKITVVFIEHDMDIVFKIAPKIVVLCYGRILATRHAGCDPQGSGRDRRLSRHRASRGGGMSARAVVQVEDLDVYYGTSQILFGVGLSVRQGETMALLGRNGAGKSTTMKAIMGLAPARRGRVLLRGEVVSGHEAASHRARRARLRAGGPPDISRSTRSRTISSSARRRARTARTTGRSSASTTSFRCWSRCATGSPAGCRAASSRCWRSPAR